MILIDRNSTVNFTKECMAYPAVRSAWGAFETANVTYYITKHNHSQMRGSLDLCAIEQPSHMRSILKMIGVPSKCPVDEVRIFT